MGKDVLGGKMSKGISESTFLCNQTKMSKFISKHNKKSQQILAKLPCFIRCTFSLRSPVNALFLPPRSQCFHCENYIKIIISKTMLK